MKTKKVTYHIVTLFPESTESYLGSSILKRAQDDGKIAIKYYNPRDFTDGSSYADRRVDDRPYGGGPGMVIEALPVMRAVFSAVKASSRSKRKVKIVFFSPHGKMFSNEVADDFQMYSDIIFVCGRYEGIDARVKKAFPMVEMSVGPYILTGGELPAMIMIDAITRRIKGVLGDHNSIEENRIAGKDVYTRPESVEFKGKKYRVPKILLSGHHKKIDDWKTAVDKRRK